VTNTPDDTTLQLTRRFDAAPERVFDAWLTRDQWDAWIGPEGMKCDVPSLDPRVGGRYRITMRLTAEQVIPVGGAYLQIDRPKRLSFTWGLDGDAARQSVITLTFTRAGLGTELTLRQEGLRDIASRDSHAKGWHAALNKLAAYLAAQKKDG
jgi:uncharacterized protein YndB with AHSA1/START domain